MGTLLHNANASLLDLKQTPLIRAASISLFANYRHSAEVIYEVKRRPHQDISMIVTNVCRVVRISHERSDIPPRSKTVLRSVDTYLRTIKYSGVVQIRLWTCNMHSKL